MKNNINRQKWQETTAPLPVNCQVLLSCLTGYGGRLPMPDFYQIWGQILPESNLAIPVSDITAQQPASGPGADRAFSASKSAKIREGPD